MPDGPAADGDRRCVALFRALNVGGHGQISMADLRAMAAGIGLAGTQTILQTGNLVFAEPGGDAGALEAALEAAAAGIGLVSDVMVRSSAEWASLVAANPFGAAARDDPDHLVLLILKRDPASSARATLRAAIKDREEIHVAGRSAYVVFPDGVGRSKLTPQVLGRHLGVPATGRNWNTVTKIGAALSPWTTLVSPGDLGQNRGPR